MKLVNIGKQLSFLKDRKLFEKYIYFTPQDPATFVSTADFIKGNNNVPDHFNTLDFQRSTSIYRYACRD